jgi:hypothetical protein
MDPRRPSIPHQISRDWLAGVGASDQQIEAVQADVDERLAQLPAHLKALSSAANGTLGLIPQQVTRRMVDMPVVSEYARLVRSLTAVAYFEQSQGDQ